MIGVCGGGRRGRGDVGVPTKPPWRGAARGWGWSPPIDCNWETWEVCVVGVLSYTVSLPFHPLNLLSGG